VNIIRENLNTLTSLFKSHKIEKAYVFGSVVTDKFNSNSDIDFLISFAPNLDPLEKGELWWDLHDKLRELFKREVDIVTESSLKNPYFIEELKQSRKLIYG